MKVVVQLQSFRHVLNSLRMAEVGRISLYGDEANEAHWCIAVPPPSLPHRHRYADLGGTLDSVLCAARTSVAAWCDVSYDNVGGK